MRSRKSHANILFGIRRHPQTPQGAAEPWLWTGLLTACLTLSFIHRGLLAVLVGPVEQGIHLSDAQMGEIQGPAFALLYALASVIFGRAADLSERRFMLSVSLLLWLLGAVTMGLADGFIVLVAGRMLVGVGCAAVLPIGASLLADLFDEAGLGVALGVFMAGAAMGDAAAVFVGGTMLTGFEQHPDWVIGGLTAWRQVMLLLALPLAGLLLWGFCLTPPDRQSLKTAASNPGRASQSLGFLLLRWRVYAPYLFAMTTAAVGGAATYWVPEVLRRSFGLTSTQLAVEYGSTLTLASLIGAGLGIVAGRLNQSPCKSFFISASAYALSAAALLLFLGTNVHACMLAMGFYVIADASTAVLLMAAIQALTPPSLRGTTAALDRFFAVSIGYSVGQPMVGWIAALGKRPNDLRGAMVGVAVLMALASAIALLATAAAVRRLPQQGLREID